MIVNCVVVVHPADRVVDGDPGVGLQPLPIVAPTKSDWTKVP
jgi:hypothetical protein